MDIRINSANIIDNEVYSSKGKNIGVDLRSLDIIAKFRGMH